MPKAYHTRFCPQCGCTATTEIDVTGRRVSFTCGEIITVKGGYNASYTCHSVPSKHAELEELMRHALRALVRVPLSAAGRISLIRAAAAPALIGIAPHASSARETLEVLGLAEIMPGEGQVRMRVSELGRRLAEQLQNINEET